MDAACLASLVWLGAIALFAIKGDRFWRKAYASQRYANRDLGPLPDAIPYKTEGALRAPSVPPHLWRNHGECDR